MGQSCSLSARPPPPTHHQHQHPTPSFSRRTEGRNELRRQVGTLRFDINALADTLPKAAKKDALAAKAEFLAAVDKLDFAMRKKNQVGGGGAEGPREGLEEGWPGGVLSTVSHDCLWLWLGWHRSGGPSLSLMQSRWRSHRAAREDAAALRRRGKTFQSDVLWCPSPRRLTPPLPWRRPRPRSTL